MIFFKIYKITKNNNKKMNDNSSGINDECSSQYSEVFSNSIDLYQLEKKKNNEKKEILEYNSKKNTTFKHDSKINQESDKKKSFNKTNYTFNNTGTYRNNRNLNITNIIKSINKEEQNNSQKESNKNKNNINEFKKKILSPIDENTNTFYKDCSTNSMNSKNNLDENNINKNININILINKKNNKINNDKFVYNNTNINNNNSIKDNSEIDNNSNININNKNENLDNNKHKKQINNTSSNINLQDEQSIYLSMDEISNITTIRKKSKKSKKNNEIKETIDTNNIESSSSFLDSNIEKQSNYENLMTDLTTIKKGNYKNTLVSKDDTITFRDYNSFMINSINLDDIPKDNLTVNILRNKYNLREIPVKRKDIQLKDRFIKTLIELQIFNFDNSPIWVLKISNHGKYLAAGNKEGKIRIYEIMGYDYEKYQNEYDNKNAINFLHFIDEKAIKELSHHKGDITDLCWSPFKKDLLLSSSIDHFVILWDISKEDNCLVEKFEHDDIVTCVQFSPINQELFATGCFDKFVRIYNISNYNNKNNFKNDEDDKKKDEKKVIKENIKNNSNKRIKDFFNLTDKITSISFFPEGNRIAIGTINGKIYIYDILYQQIRYNYSFNCRNRVGKNSLGKKITNIMFINKINAIITTSDSSIRLFSMNEGKNISKFKGYQNENSMIRASVDLSNDVIISGSENGFCYIWHIINKKNKERKNYNYEYFKPFSRDIVECSIIIEEKCYVNYIKKVFKLTNKINIISIIINSTDNGKIEVLLNISEDNK